MRPILPSPARCGCRGWSCEGSVRPRFAAAHSACRAAASTRAASRPPRRCESARSDLQILPEPFGLRPADGDFRRLRVLHPQDIVPAEPRDDLLDLVNVHEMRAMYPPEDARVEPILQLVERPIVRGPGVLLRDDGNPVVS